MMRTSLAKQRISECFDSVQQNNADSDRRKHVIFFSPSGSVGTVYNGIPRGQLHERIASIASNRFLKTVRTAISAPDLSARGKLSLLRRARLPIVSGSFSFVLQVRKSRCVHAVTLHAVILVPCMLDARPVAHRAACSIPEELLES